jgi:hypothetical protein
MSVFVANAFPLIPRFHRETMVLATVLATREVGSNESRIGKRLVLERSDTTGKSA